MELKGMTPQQLAEITSFVQKHHHFAKWLSDEERKEEFEQYPKVCEYGLNIKYVDSCYDTRTGDVWMVKFRGLSMPMSFQTNTLIGTEIKEFPFDNLYDWVMAFLKGEWNDESILTLCEIKD